jgi:hypothetical protein
VSEKTSWRYSAKLTKEDGAALGSGEAGLTLTLTLYALDAAETIINGVNALNILNDGTRGTLDANGNLAVVFLVADNPILDATLDKERHVALIQATWAAGTRAARHEVEFTVQNLSRVS